MRQIQESRGVPACPRAGHVHDPVVLPAQRAFKTGRQDYHTAADLTGQANHLGVTIEADIIKQKAPDRERWVQAPSTAASARPRQGCTTTLSPNPIDLTRWQVANCFLGRSGLINSGGPPRAKVGPAEAVRTSVINKRAGGMGMISGRKAFQRPRADGVELLQAIQDVYLDPEVTVA